MYLKHCNAASATGARDGAERHPRLRLCLPPDTQLLGGGGCKGSPLWQTQERHAYMLNQHVFVLRKHQGEFSCFGGERQ